ncbi:NUDIX domain-containing protein [Bacillus sp. DTU_2020_1000418_1_SI_GHA_SEK_038]|uniref:NUDIX hydrolase n=1 Tax=Bacillus sp. DTU_2020_1000418_1_SI_GHA_SEK_038 TaxID=3077585 RepID=UPI0028E2024F|nr:NUDIX domain-containing protein [Bacillus sp. DTU_2020_1000418_1_SI_GHA_SEK_038]WNS73556.1 NUDIX domain-containing protein [Bacillus sp. DTU_2020_1000418_1_SI_GHA_SEK_038]
MEQEFLNIFDRQRNPRGVASREEVHRAGYWHETFHCWFISEEDGVHYIYLQKRSALKKDYPDLLDITAAGHILAQETIQDGVREIKEELGIDVTFNELVPLGIIEYSHTRNEFIDNEISHVFLYKSQFSINEYILQKEEVAGIVKAEFQDFSRLMLRDCDEIMVEGFEINQFGKKITVRKQVRRKDFVPHEQSYYEDIIDFITKEINNYL